MSSSSGNRDGEEFGNDKRQGIREERDGKKARLLQHGRLTQEHKQQIQALITPLVEERRNCMRDAADYAGNLGLRYEPRTNSIFQIVIPEDIGPEVRIVTDELAGLGYEAVTHVDADSPEPVVGSDEVSDNPDVVANGSQPLEPLIDVSDVDNVREQQTSANAEVLVPTLLPSSVLKTAESSSEIEIILNKVESVRKELATQIESTIEVAPIPPERPVPQSTVKATPMIKKLAGNGWVTGVQWLFSLAIGLFVGQGLKILVGADPRSPDGLFLQYLMMSCGLAAVGLMKFLFELFGSLWSRQVALQDRALTLKTSILFTMLLLVIAEVYLGGTALQTYGNQMSLSEKSGISLLQYILVALAVSTPTLLLSFTKGYIYGQSNVTEEELAKVNSDALYEIELKEYESRLAEHQKASAERSAIRETAHKIRMQAHEDRLQMLAGELENVRLLGAATIEHQLLTQALERDALATRLKNEQLAIDERHQVAVAKEKAVLTDFQDRLERRNEAFISAQKSGALLEKYSSTRLMPDFQALMKCMNLVDALSKEIEELQKRVTNDSIALGHAAASVL